MCKGERGSGGGEVAFQERDVCCCIWNGKFFVFVFSQLTNKTVVTTIGSLKVPHCSNKVHCAKDSNFIKRDNLLAQR